MIAYSTVITVLATVAFVDARVLRVHTPPREWVASTPQTISWDNQNNGTDTVVRLELLTGPSNNMRVAGQLCEDRVVRASEQRVTCRVPRVNASEYAVRMTDGQQQLYSGRFEVMANPFGAKSGGVSMDRQAMSDTDLADEIADFMNGGGSASARVDGSASVQHEPQQAIGASASVVASVETKVPEATTKVLATATATASASVAAQTPSASTAVFSASATGTVTIPNEQQLGEMADSLIQRLNNTAHEIFNRSAPAPAPARRMERQAPETPSEKPDYGHAVNHDHPANNTDDHPTYGHTKSGHAPLDNNSTFNGLSQMSPANSVSDTLSSPLSWVYIGTALLLAIQ